MLLQALATEMQSKLVVDLTRVKTNQQRHAPRRRSVGFNEIVTIQYDEPTETDVSTVQAEISELETHTALAGVRRMSKHLEHHDELIKRKKASIKQLKASWALVLKDIDQVRAKYRR